jgi:hypothetical protein
MTTGQENKDIKIHVWNSRTFWATPQKELTWKDKLKIFIKMGKWKR